MEKLSSSEDGSSGDEENQTLGCFVLILFLFRRQLGLFVCISDRNRPKKKRKITRKGKDREWIFKKKEQLRRKGNVVPPDTSRKRKDRF
ncbi:hypothetical protein Peur_074305 [Populus x canadensis]